MQDTISTNSSKATNQIPMATTNTSKDDSGLHDLKALATSAKSRRTKRRTTQMEVQNSLLASNAGLDAVILPDPSKSVAVKMPKAVEVTEKKVAKSSAGEKTTTKTSSTAAAVAVASDIPSSPDESKSSKVGLFVVLGLAGAAAAAFVLMRGNGDSNKQAEAGTPVKTPVALVDNEAPSVETPATEAADNDSAEVVPEEALVAENGGGDDEGADKDEPAAGTPDEALTAIDTKPPEETKIEKPTRVLTEEEKVEAKRVREERIAAKLAAKEAAKAARDAAKVANAGKTEKPGKDKGKDKTLKSGDSLDDVLSSVTGGLDKEVVKKETAPVKKTLGRSDVKKAMSKVAGRAKACHAKEQYSGMVTVKYGVKPDGSLTSVSATGSHAGSATGKCVAQAVKKAKFPAFAGSPMTFTYPFMLSP